MYPQAVLLISSVVRKEETYQYFLASIGECIEASRVVLDCDPDEIGLLGISVMGHFIVSRCLSIFSSGLKLHSLSLQSSVIQSSFSLSLSLSGSCLCRR